MAKKTCKLLITTTIKYYCDYECDDDETLENVVERASNDEDLLINAATSNDVDTKIEIMERI